MGFKKLNVFAVVCKVKGMKQDKEDTRAQTRG